MEIETWHIAFGHRTFGKVREIKMTDTNKLQIYQDVGLTELSLEDIVRFTAKE